MKKRNESNSKSANRKRSTNRGAGRRADERSKKRRLSMEGLESRQLLAVLTEIPIQPAPTNLPVFDAPRDIGTVVAANILEAEGTDGVGVNNNRSTAQILPFGTGPGQEDTIDLTGTLPIAISGTSTSGFSADIDVYGFDLQGGDIIDIATQGAAGEFALQGPFGPTGLPLPGQPALTVSFASNAPVGGQAAPLQSAATSNATGVFVAPESGRYFLTIAAATQTTTYSVGLRAYRPVTESLAVGDAQILYLDWEGGLIDNNIFLAGADGGDDGPLPNFGFTLIPSLEESLPALGLEFGDVATANIIAETVYDEVVEIFQELTVDSANGDFGTTGVPGDYALRILNSRDATHRQWFESNSDDPRITRMIIGGTGLDIGIDGVLGIAQSVDVGNFDLSENALFALDGFLAITEDTPLSPTASRLDAISQFLASVAAHEAGHTFGMIHTNNANNTLSIGDAGGGLTNDFAQGLGPDGIFGTLDDVQPIFANDFFADATVRRGFSRIRDTFTHSLSSGTVGGVSSSGSVFNDANRSGTRNGGEAGLAGVTVFADINGNLLQDPSEPSAISTADGSFSLTLPPGSFDLVAVTPGDFQPTTATVLPSTGSPAFGFNQVNPNITGTTFADSNGNGFQDAGDLGIEGAFVFLDIDNDGRPDLFEPSTLSGADGSYSLNFPGPGTFTIRQVLPPGFEQTFPPGGQHVVSFDGASLTDNFDFGFLPSRDFGDAPDSFGTLLASDGASHGIVAGLSLGSLVDREANGLPTAIASGDDLSGLIDDEDGVVLASPLAPGSLGSVSVAVTNTTASPAFLQGFLDFNADGDFSDPGEQFVTDLLVSPAAGLQSLAVSVPVPAGATIGNAIARFRLSQSSGVGPTGFAQSGEVEDHVLPILAAAEIANDDDLMVSRNTLSNRLDLLANDFDLPSNPLTIETLNVTGTQGIVVLSSDRRSVDYTPPNGFVGLDRFEYTVVDSLGNRSTAEVNITVTFLSAVPIAVDDAFEVPEGSVNRPLNVLDNDVPSTSGGLTITSVAPGTSGGTIQIIGGGQSLRYTPLPGFNGTEQFTYSVQDSVGQVSSAEVTINLLPGSRGDDVVDFSVGIFDPVNINTPLTNVQVGDEFLLRVSVDDLDPNGDRFSTQEGVAAAFLDVLYTDELVTLLNTGLNPAFPFDISFGPLFSGSEAFLQRANANTPGLFDEVGGVQPLGNQQSHAGPVELFTIRMVAVSPGVAQFTADPADQTPSETVILASDVELSANQLRLGQTELIILPASANFTAAIDDSFADGLDSAGSPIVNSAPARNRLEVLNNDNLGPTDTVRELGLVTSPTFGTVFIDDNGTPLNLNDDFFSYRANVNANGLERFTYVIVTDDGVSSTAEVTIPLGNVNNNAVVGIDFSLVEANFNAATGEFESGAALPVGSSVSVGQTFGLQIDLDDLRGLNSTFVFAGYLDVLYSDGFLQPVAGSLGSEFDFGVEFGPGYVEDAGVGTAARAGIIDEFGSLSPATTLGGGSDPARLATLFFEAVTPGVARVAGGPADSSPFQDTLLFDQDQPVSVDQIRYDVLNINIGGGEGESFQNPVLAQDVNNDGAVSSIDALLVINRIGRQAGGAEGEAGSLLSSTFYTDVNGDRETSAIDALQVINYLARNRASAFAGEGELLAPVTRQAAPLADSSDDQSTSISDTVFASLDADLSGESKIVGSGLPQNATGSSIDGLFSPSSGDAATSEESDDLLGLLADDVQGRLS
jgi:hypothetical protein